MSLAAPITTHDCATARVPQDGPRPFSFFGETIAPVAMPPSDPPLLQVIVDTEEEFDWSRPFSRKTTGVRNIAHQLKAQPVFERYGLKPTYVVDHPVASQSIGYGPLREILADGRCDIGAHLQPWVNPPFVEDVSYVSSYPGNLPPEIEREKLAVLTATIERNLGVRPLVYRAGRYGLGPRSLAILDRFGYEIDASVLPGVDLSWRYGPDFSRFGPQPFRFGSTGRRLGIPLTIGHVGRLARYAATLYPWLDTRPADRFKLKAAASRLRLVERIQLTPEGFTLAEQKRLVRALLARGQRIFNLSYHSPSLMPGGAPYVRDVNDLARFLDTLEGFLDFFVNETKGRFTTPLALKRRFDRAAAQPA
ncbi:MAG: polysaccharide deacetylase family protein [Alphaproteobacteria bacterium]|nr:polysaccharide deacetylase family protein [Alphaproteobacteria bacterium]